MKLNRLMFLLVAIFVAASAVRMSLTIARADACEGCVSLTAMWVMNRSTASRRCAGVLSLVASTTALTPTHGISSASTPLPSTFCFLESHHAR